MPTRFRRTGNVNRPGAYFRKKAPTSVRRATTYFIGSQAGGDVIAPTANIVSTTRSKISAVTGFDSTDIVWTADEAFQAYQFRVVADASDPYTSGVQLEANQNPAAGGAALTEYTSTITDDEVIAASPAEGVKLVKLFVQDSAGNWST